MNKSEITVNFKIWDAYWSVQWLKTLHNSGKRLLWKNEFINIKEYFTKQIPVNRKTLQHDIRRNSSTRNCTFIQENIFRNEGKLSDLNCCRATCCNADRDMLHDGRIHRYIKLYFQCYLSYKITKAPSIVYQFM